MHNKNLKGQVSFSSKLQTIAYLEISYDGGSTFDIVDQITVEANIIPNYYDFPSATTIDVDNPLLKIKIRLVPQTTTTTSTTSTTSSTTTTTTTEAPSPFRYATEQDAANIFNANVGDMLLTGPNVSSNIDIRPSLGNTFTLDGCKKILIKGGNYGNIRIEVPGLTGTEECPIIITNYDGQVRCRNLSIIGLSHYKVTGKYDPINLTGDENYKGHSEGYANTAGKYGIFVSNDWTSVTAHLISISGSKQGSIVYQTTNFELEYIETGNGGFSNVIKTDGVSDVMTNVSIHDMYIHDTHSEGIYVGSTQGDPQHPIKNLHFYNNRVLRAGNDGVQFGQLQEGCIIENNVIHGAINWKSPFSPWQDNSVQLSLRNGGIAFRNNICIVGGEKWVNFFLNKYPGVTPSGYIDIENNAFIHCRGILGVYFGQSNPMPELDGVRLRSNFFARFKYEYDEVYTTLGVNNVNLIRCAMRANTFIEGNRWDGSDIKLNLYYAEPFAREYISEIDNEITLIDDVEFVDYMGFPVGYDYQKVELWSKFVGIYEGQDSGWFPNEGTKKGEPIYYEVDDIVLHKSKVYKCLAYNTAIEPEVTADWETYWEHIDYNGNDIPTDDVRLVSTSFYNGRGMGLLDNPVYDGPTTTTSTTSTSTTTTLAPTTTTTTTLPVTPAFNYKTYAKDNGDNTFTVKWGINRDTLINNPLVVGIGSSTLQGTGNTAGLGLDDRFNDYFNSFGGKFVSLGQNGYNSFNWMPRGSNANVDNNKNSTTAKCFNPSFAVIVTATNDVENNTPEEGLANLLTIYNDLKDAGIVTFIEASQPRTNYSTERQVKLIQLKNLIKAYFPAEVVIDTIDVLKDPNSDKPANYLPAYAQNDGIHLNDTGVGVLFDLFKNKFENTLIDSEFVSWEIERSDNPNNSFTLFDTVSGGNIVSKTYDRIDDGEYYFRVRGKRSDNSYGNYTFISNKLEQTNNIGSEEQTIQLDFSTNTTSFPPEDWNNLQAETTGPAIGTIYSNIIDSNYNSTPIEIEVIDSFTGTGSAGGNAGKYPVRIAQDYWYKANNTKNNAILRIGNLETNKVYKFEIYSSRSTGEQRYIGADANNIYSFCAALNDDGTSNISMTGILSPLYPDVDGNIFIYFSGIAIGHLNGLVIHKHGIIPSGQTTTTTSSTSTSTSSTTTTTTTLSAPDAFTINVNLFNGSNPTNNEQWNNWNLVDSANPTGINNLKYANGTDSNINATSTAFNNFFDNGGDYGEGIGVPAEVLRTGLFTTESNYNASVATITLTGLNNANRYSFELIASRNNITGNSTSFQAIGSTTVTSESVNTDRNKNNPIVISEIFPNAGTITLKIRKAGGTYGYANALRIFEIIPGPTTTTTSSSSSTSSTTSTTTTFGTTTTTTTLFPTTTTTTTIGGSGTLTKISGWKSDSPNQYGWIYTPPGYDNSGNTKYPFIVFLHGQGERNSGSSGADVLIQSGKGVGYYLNQGDTPQNVVIFIPQLPTGTWEPVWVEPARQYVLNNYNGDVDKFYLTGLSLGGSGTSKYVMTYPDRVAAYLIATGDTQYQRGSNAAATVNGIRQADVPGWFHGGTADTTINVNNGVTALTALNALSPKPIYPFLVNTYWGLGHNNDVWGNKVYNRKNRTDAIGSSAFDYIDWFKLFKRNDLIHNATSFVGVAEQSFDYNDYLIALRLVNKLNDGADKTNLLAKLGVVKNVITSQNKILVLNFGSITVGGSINNINIIKGQAVNNLIDIDGNTTNISFNLPTSKLNNPDVALGTGNDYFGFNTAMLDRAFRISGTPNQWILNGANNTKKYTLRFFYGNLTQNNSVRWGVKATINSITKEFLDENVNTNKYVDFDNITPNAGNITIDLEALTSNVQGDISALVVFEKIEQIPTTTSTSTTSTSSTTTSSTTSTTSTSTSTSSTTTTLEPTTTSTTSTSSTTTSTTSSTTSSSTTSTTTSSTSSTTTTTTTLEPSGDIAKFNFNLNAQSISGWNDVTGSPHSGVVSKTDSTTGITVASISGKWGNFGGSANNGSGGTGTNADFPTNVLSSFWYNYSNVYPANGACIKISNLTPSTSYQLKMIGSRSSTAGSGIPEGQQRLMEFTVSQVATVGDSTEQNNQTYASRDSITTQSFTINSNASGELYLGVYASRTGNGTNGDQFGYINGLIIEKL